MRLPRKWITLLGCLLAAAEGVAQGAFSELLTQGSALAKQGDYKASIAKLEAAKTLNPSDYKVNLLLGIDFLRLGRPDAALVTLRIAAESPSDDGSAAAYLGAANFAVGAFGPAAEAFQQAVSRAPHSEEFLAKWGDVSLERFRTLQMQLQASQSGMAAVLRFQAERTNGVARVELLERSTLADPQQPGIWGELGVAALQAGNLEKAEESLGTAQNRQAEDLWTIRLQALLASQHGNWTGAQSRLAEIAERSPAVFLVAVREWPARLKPAQTVAGMVWDCLRQPASPCAAKLRQTPSEDDRSPATLFAQQRWEDLAAVTSDHEDEILTKYWRGTALAQLQDFSRAIPLLEDGLDAGQERAAFLLLICYAAAATDAADRLSASNFVASAHRVRGDFFVRVEGDAPAAITEYQQAIRVQSHDATLQERLAQAYWSGNRSPEARKAAEAALTLQPNRPMSLRLLASIAMEERDYKAAEESLTKLVALNSGDAWARVQLGIAFAQTGQWDRAITLFQQEFERGYPDERGAIHAILARALRKLGRAAEAAEAEAESARLADQFQQGAPKVSDEM